MSYGIHDMPPIMRGMIDPHIEYTGMDISRGDKVRVKQDIHPWLNNIKELQRMLEYEVTLSHAPSYCETCEKAEKLQRTYQKEKLKQKKAREQARQKRAERLQEQIERI